MSSNPIITQAKEVLCYILNSDNVTLRRRGLEFAMELLSETNLDYVKIENAIKAEIEGDKNRANKIIEQILKEIDLATYS